MENMQQGQARFLFMICEDEMLKQSIKSVRCRLGIALIRLTNSRPSGASINSVVYENVGVKN
jgi:hypothetical protein